MEGIERRTLPREPNHQVADGGPFVHSHSSLWFGTGLVVMGVLVHLLAALQYTRLVHRAWQSGECPPFNANLPAFTPGRDKEREE